MVREIRVQSQVESYQRLKKWYLMSPCLALNTIREESRVKWCNPGNGVAPSSMPRCTGWNDKIVALEKTTWFHFRLMKTGFLFVVVDHLLVGQLCTNPKSDRSLLSCLKVIQCSTSEIGESPLYNSCSLPIQVMTTGPLPATSKCKSGLPRLTGTCPGWWKQSFRLRLWSLVWFQVRATWCHLTSSKSACKSTPKCTLICWRVWWSPGAIRWPVADPGCGSRTRRRSTSPKRLRLGFRRSATTLYPSLTGSPPPLSLLDYFVWSYVENITNMTSHNTKASLIAAIRRVFAELPPVLVEKACSQFRIRIEAVIEAEGGYIE